MKLRDAIDFWGEESGQRQIQQQLSEQTHGTSKQRLSEMLNAAQKNNRAKVEDAIQTLLDAMETAPSERIYQRGSEARIRKPHIREGFLSLTTDPKKAQTQGETVKVRVPANIRRLSFEKEGNETLLEPGLRVTQSTDGVMEISKRSTSNTLPFQGNLVQEERQKAAIQLAQKTLTALHQLYCFLISPPDEVLGQIGLDCDEDDVAEFGAKSVEEQIGIVRALFKGLPSQEAFLQDFLAGTSLDTSIVYDLLDFTTNQKGGAQRLHILQGNQEVGGQRLTQQQTAIEPRVSIPPGYTLLMQDPDAVKPDWIHWLASATTTFLPQQGPTPPPGTGVHRYRFVLFQGAPRKVPSPTNRGGQNVSEIMGQPLEMVEFTVAAL